MNCPCCNSAMITETVTEHFHDPADSHGHGERVSKILVCELRECGYQQDDDDGNEFESDE